jgi:ferredoxin/flavodoxin---NADP+ reductase
VHLVARRGPAQAKFGPVELREMGALAACDCIVWPEDVALNPASAAEVELPSLHRMLTRLEHYAHRAPAGKPKRFTFHFLRTPLRVEGTSRVESILFEKNVLEGEPFHQEARGTGETERIACGLIVSCIGYRNAALPGIPYDARRGRIPNKDGRIVEGDAPLPGCYVTGWAKTGPQGQIGANKPVSQETVAKLLEDLPRLRPCPEPDDARVFALLRARGVRVVTWDEWRRLDALEIARGVAMGKPRERFRSTRDMLDALKETSD